VSLMMKIVVMAEEVTKMSSSGSQLIIILLVNILVGRAVVTYNDKVRSGSGIRYKKFHDGGC